MDAAKHVISNVNITSGKLAYQPAKYLILQIQTEPIGDNSNPLMNHSVKMQYPVLLSIIEFN